MVCVIWWLLAFGLFLALDELTLVFDLVCAAYCVVLCLSLGLGAYCFVDLCRF